MLSRVERALRQVAPRGARLLAQQADAVTPYRELASTTVAQREVSAHTRQQISTLCLKKPKVLSCMPTTLLTVSGVGHAG